jgi:hypothetical protein
VLPFSLLFRSPPAECRRDLHLAIRNPAVSRTTRRDRALGDDVERRANSPQGVGLDSAFSGSPGPSTPAATSGGPRRAAYSIQVSSAARARMARSSAETLIVPRVFNGPTPPHRATSSVQTRPRVQTRDVKVFWRSPSPCRPDARKSARPIRGRASDLPGHSMV